MATPEEMAATMVRNLPEKTGKSLPQWLKITKACGLSKHGQIVKFLKEEHGVSHGFANMIAHHTLKSAGPAPSSADLVGDQYAGKKEGLKPIYDALIKAARALGADVELAPKKANVSLRRTTQFALIQPSTATRVDLGLKLKGEPTSERLEASGSFSAMVTHRVRLTSTKDVNAELKRWLKKAYQAN